MEPRALAIAFFYAIGTAAGGISGPLLFSHLVATKKVSDTVLAFSIGATPDDPRRAGRDIPRGQGRAAEPRGHRTATDGRRGKRSPTRPAFSQCLSPLRAST